MALFHIKLQSIPSLILFILTDYPQFYDLEVTLNTILMIGLSRSNNKMVIFSKAEKNHITANTNGTMLLWRRHRSGVGWRVLKFAKCLQIFFVFKQKNKRSIVHFCFLQMEGVGGHTIGHTINLNILKLQLFQLVEAAVSS